VNSRLSNKEKQRLRAERAAAALKEKQRRERRRQILTTVGVLAVIALIVAGGFLINSMRDSSSSKSVPPPDSSSVGLTIGPPSAPHTVIVYEDFLCPFCGELEKNTHEELAQLADAGKVQVEYRPIVFLSQAGPYSARATLMWWLVAQQDGDDVAKKFHDLLFANQPSEQGPFHSRDDLYTLAGQAGADTDKLKAAVENQEGVNEVTDATKAAEKLGIKGTPTIFLDGKQFTNGRTVDDLAANLLKALQ
jgi:protein-disulfide isomerase